MIKKIEKIFIQTCHYIFCIFVIPFFLICSLIARFFKKNTIGIGPEPLINNIFHAKALKNFGFEVETFVNNTYYITKEFDYICTIPFLKNYILFLRAIFKYKFLLIYFNGGPLGFTPAKYLEPFLYKISKTKTIVTSYGSDVQSFFINNDCVYKSTYISDYPNFMKTEMLNKKDNIIRWTKHSNWIISGCDWVKYVYYWDSLILSHFCVDYIKEISETDNYCKIYSENTPLIVAHAFNHRNIKGTNYIIKIVNKLREKNINIDLRLINNIPNNEAKKIISESDVIIDQLVIGWYGMFAVEAMAFGKPVICYIDHELERLYVMNNLIDVDELPFLKADHLSLEKILEDIYFGKINLKDFATKSVKFVKKHHSLESIGKIFSDIIKKVDSYGI